MSKDLPQPDGLKPGIYFGLPDYDYRSDPAVAQSDIKNLLESPREYWENSCLNPEWTPKEPTQEMIFGRVMHCLLFEPEKFEQDYYIFPGQARSSNKEMVKRGDYDRLYRMAETVREHPDSKLMLGGGMGEVTVIWIDPTTGVRCKARHDYFKPLITADYKTAASVREDELTRAFRNHHYDIQNAHYVESRVQLRAALTDVKDDEGFVIKPATAKIFICGELVDKEAVRQLVDAFKASSTDAFGFICQRKTPPHPVEIVEYDTDTGLDQARQDIAYGLQRYAESIRRYGPERWPATSGQIKQFHPRYGFARA